MIHKFIANLEKRQVAAKNISICILIIGVIPYTLGAIWGNMGVHLLGDILIFLSLGAIVLVNKLKKELSFMNILQNNLGGFNSK